MKSSFIKYLKYFGLILLGNILYSFGVKAIIQPNGFVTGGITGLSLFLENMYGWNSTILVAIFTAIIFVAGLLILGKELAAQTLASSIIYPICLWVFDLMDLSFMSQITDKWMLILSAGIIIGTSISSHN